MRAILLATTSVALAAVVLTAGCGSDPDPNPTGGGGEETCGTSGPCGELTCCDGQCVDVKSDALHCGACGSACSVPHAAPACVSGACEVATCDAGHFDCDGALINGCEHQEESPGKACFTDSPLPFCAKGQLRACYAGPEGTAGVGACKSGVQICEEKDTWGPCTGEVHPTLEVCGNDVDDDCDGHSETEDADGDGYSACDGDCWDASAPCTWECKAPDPPLCPQGVNPGALDIPANGLDDDCDPATPDSGPVTCSDMDILDGVTAMDLARALDLCVVTVEEPPSPADLRPGLISAKLTRADGLGTPAAVQVAVRTSFGGAVVPVRGATMIALSTGSARTPEEAGFSPPNPGLAATGPGNGPFEAVSLFGPGVPDDVACNSDPEASWAMPDSVRLDLRLRAPSNAHGFSIRTWLYTAEYPDRLCAPQGDTVLGILKSSWVGPLFSFLVEPFPDGLPGELLTVNNLDFAACAPSAGFTCPDGTSPLLGTGYEQGASLKPYATTVPIKGGETLDISLIVGDGTDTARDSTALFDAFEWTTTPPSGDCGPE